MKPRLQRTGVALAILAAMALGLTACGEKSEPEIATKFEDPHAAIKVIDDWSGRLSEGDTEGAAALFAVPSIAENGTVPLRLTSREEVLAFNRSLPCGAELVRAKTAGHFIAATFRLTERPGGACGQGVGGLARTAFVIEDGHITQWRRLPDPEPPEPEGPIV